jgi:hypothetical protein
MAVPMTSAASPQRGRVQAGSSTWGLVQPGQRARRGCNQARLPSRRRTGRDLAQPPMAAAGGRRRGTPAGRRVAAGRRGRRRVSRTRPGHPRTCAASPIDRPQVQRPSRVAARLSRLSTSDRFGRGGRTTTRVAKSKAELGRPAPRARCRRTRRSEPPTDPRRSHSSPATRRARSSSVGQQLLSTTSVCSSLTTRRC